MYPCRNVHTVNSGPKATQLVYYVGIWVPWLHTSGTDRHAVCYLSWSSLFRISKRFEKWKYPGKNVVFLSCGVVFSIKPGDACDVWGAGLGVITEEGKRALSQLIIVGEKLLHYSRSICCSRSSRLQTDMVIVHLLADRVMYQTRARQATWFTVTEVPKAREIF